MRGRPLPDGYAYGAEQIDATQTHHKRWSPPAELCKFCEKETAFLTPFRSHFTRFSAI